MSIKPPSKPPIWDALRNTARPDLAEQHSELPVRGLLACKRDQVADLNNKLDENGWTPDLSGATVGRRRPLAFSRIFGPIGLQTTRRVGVTAFKGLATLVQPNTFILPTTRNIITGRNTTFFWTGVHAVSYLSWTYTAQPDERAPTVPLATGGLPAGNLFDPVIEKNGGAQLLLNNSGFSFTSADANLLGQDDPGKPKLCFQIELYDKRRGRFVSDGRLPGEMFATGGYGPKELGAPVRVDPDSEIEPRVYVTECRMNSFLDTAANYNVASVACWINLVLRGYATTEVQS